MVRVLVQLLILALIWLCGYNYGSNVGYDIATKLERESCEKQMKTLQEGQACQLRR